MANVFFQSENLKLKDQIDKLAEDRTNLRAKYLSDLALNKLSEQADEMNMVQASKVQAYTVEKKNTKEKGLERFFDSIREEIERPRELNSGY